MTVIEFNLLYVWLVPIEINEKCLTYSPQFFPFQIALYGFALLWLVAT